MLGDYAGQVWFLTGCYIFVATAIAVAVLPFYIISNFEDQRGNLDKGVMTRLDWLQTLSWLYCGGAGIGTISSATARFVFEANIVVWFWSGFMYILVAGLTTGYLVSIARSTTAFVYEKDENPKVAKGEDHVRKHPIRNSFCLGYLAAVYIIILFILSGGFL